MFFNFNYGFQKLIDSYIYIYIYIIKVGIKKRVTERKLSFYISFFIHKQFGANRKKSKGNCFFNKKTDTFFPKISSKNTH